MGFDLTTLNNNDDWGFFDSTQLKTMLGLRQFFTHQTCGGKIWNLLKIRDWEWESSALLAGGCRSIDSSTLLVVLHTSDIGRGCEFSERWDWGPIELYAGVCSSVGSTI